MDNDDDGQLSLRRRLNKETDVGMYSFFVARRPSLRSFIALSAKCASDDGDRDHPGGGDQSFPLAPCHDGRGRRRESRR